MASAPIRAWGRLLHGTNLPNSYAGAISSDSNRRRVREGDVLTPNLEDYREQAAAIPHVTCVQWIHTGLTCGPDANSRSFHESPRLVGLRCPMLGTAAYCAETCKTRSLPDIRAPTDLGGLLLRRQDAMGSNTNQ